MLKDTVSMDALPSATPPRLKRLIARCLDRDLKTRLRDIGETRVKIARIEAGGPDAAATAPASASRLPMAVAAGMAIVAVGSLLTYDLHPDGKRMVALMPVEAAEGQKAQNQVTFLLNWFDELRRKVPVGK